MKSLILLLREHNLRLHCLFAVLYQNVGSKTILKVAQPPALQGLTLNQQMARQNRALKYSQIVKQSLHEHPPLQFVGVARAPYRGSINKASKPGTFVPPSFKYK